MKKTRFLFIALLLVLVINYTNQILASEITLTPEEELQKQEIITLINDYLTYMDGKIIAIDNIVETARKQDEFAYYPAIRLNIDTPFFGVSSILESKLRIKKEVSTTDIANQYSVRDIIKDKVIRLPESYLGSIVVSTKECKLDDTMTLAQARVTLVKCIQYVSQVENAKTYVDAQINQTFRDYIKEDKKDALNSIKDKASKCETDLENISEQIMKLRFMGKDISALLERYNTISAEVAKVNKNSKNTLIVENDLVELNKKAISCEGEVVTLKADVQTEYENALEDMNYATVLQAIYNNISASQKEIKAFIDGGKKEVTSIVDGKEVKEEITIYTVSSASTLDTIDDTIENLIEKQKTYEESFKLVPETTGDTLLTREEKIAENTKKIDELYSIYKNILSKEYKFYTNNINELLKDSNTKTTSIINQLSLDINIDNSVFDYIKYIYIELPTNLTNYVENNNLDSVIELNNLVKELKVEIKNLSEKNGSITKLHEEILKKALES